MKTEKKPIVTEIYEALGEASMCWNPIPTGVFESSRAAEIGERLVKIVGEYTSQPMSAEQVEELGYYYPLFKFFSDEHGLSLLDSQLQDVIHECKKFIEPTTPSVKADGWVSVQEKQRLESIIELKEKERQEWANMCIRNKKILDGLISGYCTVNEYMYDEYGKLILKEISETFLKNATKADRLSDTEVFQALGETILNFPLPSPPKQQL